MSDESKVCFVIMPISDPEGYPPGHFDRVYRYLIQPACRKAGFVPFRADEDNKTNFIVADIVRQIVVSEMTICDLSTRNPNVMYELGIRHAFRKPITLIRDSKTPRVFDIQGLRDLEYDANLRVDNIDETIVTLADRLQKTFQAGTTDVNSPLQFLNMAAAKTPPAAEVSLETTLVLNAISGLGDRLLMLEQQESRVTGVTRDPSGFSPLYPPKGCRITEGRIEVGDMAWHPKFGVGRVPERNDDTLRVTFPGVGVKILVASYLARALALPVVQSESEDQEHDERRGA